MTVDLLNQTAPALSATSDTPVLSPPPAAAPAPAPTPSADPPPVESQDSDGSAKTGDSAQADPAAGEGGDKAGDPKPAKGNGIEKRFSELTQQRNAANARAETAEKAVSDLSSKLETVIQRLDDMGKTQDAQRLKDEADADKKPERSQFGDIDAYETALTDWGVRQGKRQADADRQQADAEAQTKREKAKAKKAEEDQKAEFETLQRTWTDRRTKAVEKYTDYAEVAERDDLQISIPMTHAILNSDNGPDIAYHLGKNPEMAIEIGKLSPLQQMLRIGQMSAELARTPPNVSKAPPPITPLSGQNNNAAERSLDDLSSDEYAARRTQQNGGKPIR